MTDRFWMVIYMDPVDGLRGVAGGGSGGAALDVSMVLGNESAPFELEDDEAATPPAHRRDIKRTRAENDARIGKFAPLVVQEDA